MLLANANAYARRNSLLRPKATAVAEKMAAGAGAGADTGVLLPSVEYNHHNLRRLDTISALTV